MYWCPPLHAYCCSNDLYLLDTESLKWEHPGTSEATPAGRQRHTACLVNNKKLFVLGGEWWFASEPCISQRMCAVASGACMHQWRLSDGQCILVCQSYVIVTITITTSVLPCSQ